MRLNSGGVESSTELSRIPRSGSDTVLTDASESAGASTDVPGRPLTAKEAEEKKKLEVEKYQARKRRRSWR
jgi:hypothetical protein